MTSHRATTPQQIRSDYVDRAERLAVVLDDAGPRWDAPTPCDGWTVRDVVRHAVDTEGELLARHGLASPLAPDAPHPADAEDLAASWRAWAAGVAAVVDDEALATTYDGFFGPTTVGETLRDFYTWDLAVHAWDVARATGQAYALSDAEAAAHEETAAAWGDALYAEGVCAGPVPVAADASAWERLLGRLGRDPGWSAPAVG
ncbi:TIGR03086 family metal-binding protein [Nocardioides zeae]|uniref:TIGR03086 family metal-binding protein n=1 Tax=Nocardioides imazamoxiresistens TaxID=3231893 RepID=A0ABU3Q116_9ACTN|nr:TIGR03086 family metal-binding protein [Nocardioides zeae]MDT9595207.1 TIGR03086 family metal-binding protein [Nocardioides zeae]